VKSFLVTLATVAGGFGACYDPATVDCTVSCSGEDECATGQTCGSDGFCASPDVAGQCIDPVSLEIDIEGDGTVAIDGIGECNSRTATDHRCIYVVPPNQRRDLEAMPNGDKTFKHWTSTCVGETATCAVTPVTDVTRVGAKFE
jgi:hypothetical protein